MSWKYLNRNKVSSQRLYEILRSPVVTEKSSLGVEHNQVTFKVARDAAKWEIKQAVEALFSVKVLGVNTLNQQGKSKRFRGHKGERKGYKKAIVTLAEGSSIDFGSSI